MKRAVLNILLAASVDIQDFSSPVVFDSYEKLHDAPVNRKLVLMLA